MRKWLILALALSVVAGCTNPESKSETVEGEKGGPALTTSKSLEVMAFKGGYGTDFYEACAAEYAKSAGIEAKVVGDARIDQQIQPRMQKGDPPDLMFPGWRFDHWKAVSDGAVMDLTPFMDGKAADGTTPWKDTFEASLLKLGQADGKQYTLPYFYSVLGWWYDPDLFKAKGWEVPATYTELLALCQKIRAAGIAPITYQGQYPDYMIAGMLQPWVISAGGIEAFTAMQNLEPGAWKSPAVVKAASMIRELRDMGYFQTGATAMSHTEAQAEFVNGRAAMVPCGTWLFSEMSGSMREGQKMEFMLPPVLADGKGDASAVMIKIEPWMVPAQAKNQEHAIGLFKHMTTVDKAKAFVTEKGTLMALKGSDAADKPAYLQGAADKFKASKTVWAAQWKEWYPDFYKAVENAVTELLNGKLDPAAFADKCEKAAEALRSDSRVVKRKVS